MIVLLKIEPDVNSMHFLFFYYQHRRYDLPIKKKKEKRRKYNLVHHMFGAVVSNLYWCTEWLLDCLFIFIFIKDINSMSVMAYKYNHILNRNILASDCLLLLFLVFQSMKEMLERHNLQSKNLEKMEQPAPSLELQVSCFFHFFLSY